MLSTYYEPIAGLVALKTLENEIEEALCSCDAHSNQRRHKETRSFQKLANQNPQVVCESLERPLEAGRLEEASPRRLHCFVTPRSQIFHDSPAFHSSAPLSVGANFEFGRSGHSTYQSCLWVGSPFRLGAPGPENRVVGTFEEGLLASQGFTALPEHAPKLS